MKLTMQAEFSNMNTRAERAGDEPGESAVDLTFSCSLPIEKTAMLFGDQRWMTAFFDAVYNDDNPLPNLKQMNWNREINNVAVNIDPDFMDPIEIGKCSLSKIVTTPNDGRYIAVKFRLQAHPTAEEVGHLYEIQGRDVELSLNSTQGDMFDDDGEPESEAPDAEASEAEDETEGALE